MGQFNYFSNGEIKNLDLEFVAMLDRARHKAGIPFVITSGFRSPEDNFNAGGVQGSSHTKGLAVDLRCHSSTELWHILDGLFSAGFTRIGIYHRLQDNLIMPAHVHVDASLDLPQNVTWLKYEHDGS